MFLIRELMEYKQNIGFKFNPNTRKGFSIQVLKHTITQFMRLYNKIGLVRKEIV